MEGFRVSINMYDFCVLAVYRPPSDSIENFCLKMKHVHESYKFNNKKVILIDDFNINFANESSENDMFFDFRNSYHFITQINKRTRIPTTIR